MNQNILRIPLDKKSKYNGPLHKEFKVGNELTPDWEVISTSLIDGVKFAVYYREIASVLFNGMDIEFLWNEDTRNLLSEFEDLKVVDFFREVIRHRSVSY